MPKELDPFRKILEEAKRRKKEARKRKETITDSLLLIGPQKDVRAIARYLAESVNNGKS